jgi:hypothetical protein
MDFKHILNQEMAANKRFNLDSWAFAATKVLAASCFSVMHLSSYRGRSRRAYTPLGTSPSPGISKGHKGRHWQISSMLVEKNLQ